MKIDYRHSFDCTKTIYGNSNNKFHRGAFKENIDFYTINLKY